MGSTNRALIQETGTCDSVTHFLIGHGCGSRHTRGEITVETRIDDEGFMNLAIAQAAKGDARPGAGEVGCVIVHSGEVVAAGYNEAELRHDPTAHAEIVTMRKLGEKLRSTDFRGYTLYCTLQPCSMCTVACIWGKISRIVYGAGRNNVHSMYFDTKHINAVDLIADAFRDDLAIIGGVLADKCAELYYRPSDSPPPSEQDNI
jgi:tRNA(adenine34) deaminase